MSISTFRRYALGISIAGVLLTGCSASQAHDPANSIETALERHPIVELSRTEGTGNKTELRLVEDLLDNRRLESDLDDVVIECGNSLYQPLLDRYVAGANVTPRQLSDVWRKTTQIIGCEADPTTKMLIDFVRNLNRTAPEHPLRVLAADPPINWDAIHTRSQFDAFLSQRDRNAASVIENQVLAKHHRALVIIGGDHLARRPAIGSGVDATITLLVERKHPGSTYVIFDIEDWSRFNAGIQQMVASWRAPSIVPIAGTSLAFQNAQPITAPDTMLRVGSRWIPVKNDFPGETLGQLFDAVLYLGPLKSLQTIELEEPTDQPYAHELQQMRALVTGAPSRR